MTIQYNKVFPEDISQGVVGGPEFLTDITKLRSGAEERNTPWSHPLHRYDAGLGIRDTQDLYTYQEFFYNTRGMLRSFRFKDWSDFRTNKDVKSSVTPLDEILGEGDGTTYFFRTYKNYGDYKRRITNPRILKAKVAFDGDEVSQDDFFVDDLNGTIVFLTPPESGVSITWGGEFDVPVRFDSDYIPTELKLFSLGQVPNIPIIEVRVQEDIDTSLYQNAIETLSELPKTELYELTNVYDYTVNTHWKGFWDLRV